MKGLKPFPRSRAWKLIACLAVLVVAYFLKAYYSQADSESLAWIMAPTAYLSERLSGIPFLREPGFGWVNLEHGFVIAPACAGVNFLIVAFCLSSFQVIFRSRSVVLLAGLVFCAGTTAYLLTIVANGIRIWVSVIFYRAEPGFTWFSPAEIHRIVGVTIYYLFLCFYYQAVSFILRDKKGIMQHSGRKEPMGSSGLVFFVPLAWYLLFSIGMPYMNDAYRRSPELFFEHLVSVGATSVFITLVLFLLARVCRVVFPETSYRVNE